MFKSDFNQALNDYKKVRRSEAVQAILSRIVGSAEEADLLSYDEVRSKLQAVEKNTQQLQEIPLDAIVGSVGRYHDFTRKFLPKSSIDEMRWARVKASTLGLSGLPPIEVYQIGEVYFVRDGNHRVSVAQEMGNTLIQAYVTEVKTKVSLTPDATPDDLIIKAEQVRFLEKTDLDKSRPDADLTATKAGAFPTLLEHIEVHRYFMGLEQNREIPYPESASHWYDAVFLPIANIIKNRGLLKEFPNRTVVDLYLWAADHRAELEGEIGWDIGPEAALRDLAEKHRGNTVSAIMNFLAKVLSKLQPPLLEDGPPPGTWRDRLSKMTVLEHIFNDVVVALDDSPNAWHALDMAINLGHFEHSRIHGIHIHPPGSENHDHSTSEETFNRHCQNAGISGYDFQSFSGDISTILCASAKYSDLLLLPLNHPPDDKPISRLNSGLTAIIRGCPTPILTVPGPQRGFKNILLAFDSSLKAVEAMFIAAYFGTQFSSNLYVVTSEDGFSGAEGALDQARTYLADFPLQAKYILSKASIPEAIKDVQDQAEIDLILMGGYGGSILRDLVAGSVVDQVLREIRLPVLICR